MPHKDPAVKAVQALAVHWGHQPWSDSWAELVVKTVSAQALDRKGPLDEIAAERERQHELWGQQDHAPEGWLSILTEEVGEVAKEIADGLYAPFDEAAYRLELIQTAAVAVAAVQALDRKQVPALDRSAPREVQALDRKPPVCCLDDPGAWPCVTVPSCPLGGR